MFLLVEEAPRFSWVGDPEKNRMSSSCFHELDVVPGKELVAFATFEGLQ